MFTITIPIDPRMPSSKVTEICKDYACKAKKIPGDRYEISTEDPLFFFHLGVNLYKKLCEK